MKGKKLKLQTKDKSYRIEDSVFYKLSSKKNLARILFVELSELSRLQEDSNYTIFKTGKDGKKKRLIECPKYNLDKIHTRIASLLCRIKSPEYLHSGVKHRSNVSNADSHKGKHAIFTTDITSFFPSTTKQQVFNFFFKRMKCSSDVADILANICTFRKHIPTGSRISMPLAFWANVEMFENLYAFAKSKSINMTLYVDDLTFSGSAVNRSFAYNVKKIISRFGHSAHPEKSKLYSDTQQKLITGVIVGLDGIQVRNKLLKNIHEDFRGWKQLKDLKLTDISSIEPRLIGRLNAAACIDKRYKDKLRSLKKII